MSEDWLCYCENLYKSYQKKEVLKGCSFSIKQGELVGLIGENGSGKSTLVRCLLGFTKPDAGIFSLKGTVGYCPQDNSLHKKYTVQEHFNLVDAIYGKHLLIDRDYVQRLIHQFKLKNYLNTLIGNLSSGTYQKVKLISSLYHRPRLLLLDEPYDGFDWMMYQQFLKITAELVSSGSGIFMISHFIYDFEKFDRIYELNEGKIEKGQSFK